MRTLTLVILLTMSYNACALAQPKHQHYLDELIAAENAFVKLAADSGVKQAFMLTLNEKSINFGANMPVDGLTLWKASPNNNKAQLVWHASNAAISSAGDLGFTMVRLITNPMPIRHVHLTATFFRYGNVTLPASLK